LWNSAEKVETQWNSQLARKIIIALPIEIPTEQYAELVRSYCREQFVSKGMCCDFAVHDKGDGNPHTHIMLTMRAIDENGKWLPKCRKVYELDEHGNRIGNTVHNKQTNISYKNKKKILLMLKTALNMTILKILFFHIVADTELINDSA